MRRRLLSCLLALGAVTALLVTAGAPVATAGDGYSADIGATIDDIQSFWADALPRAYGTDYEAIPDSRLHPYSQDDPPPACGGSGTAPYEEVKGNAFYCPYGDFVAWDTQQLMPQLEHDYGRFAVALVLAHEWGHVIQSRTDTALDADVYVELQADCFAGSWARHSTLESGGSTRAVRSDLEGALGGYLQFRDPPGVDPGQQGAHGNAFDRITAFQDGFANGTDRCRDYQDDPPNVTEDSFTTYEDQANNGDLPYSELQSTLRKALDDFWTSTAGNDASVSGIEPTDGTPQCAGSDGGVLDENVVYCASDNTIRYRSSFVEQAYEHDGDMGAGMLLAAAWSSSVQHASDEQIGTTDARIQADCLTGSWAGAVWRGEGMSREDAISLSPGDLDEAVRAFVGFGADGSTTAFERVQSFGRGFSDGPRACDRAFG